MASSRAATYIAFSSIVKRSLTTLTTTRTAPIRPPFVPHHRLASSRKIPRNHFTSNRPSWNESNNDAPKKPPKRKAAHRVLNTTGTSLRRVAVEAERSRGQKQNHNGSLIIGRGKNRHVDPGAQTKEVTAYCAAETYNIHVARDLLRKEGWKDDPCHTDLFPQVLHIQSKHSSNGNGNENEEVGDVFIFPSGSVVTWNIPSTTAHHLVERTLVPAASKSHISTLEAEDLEYIEDPSRETSDIIGDTIILGTAPLPSSHDERDAETDAILAKIAFSSALARSTKLAVLESNLATYMQTTHDIPSLLASGKLPPVTRGFVLRKTGELLHIRAQLNLYSELTDSLPDIFWDSPHELGLENYYDSVGKVLDVGQRIKALNDKMDHAAEITRVLGGRLSEKHGHTLEWIIIWLILVEVMYGSWHIFWEWDEARREGSTTNLLRRYLEMEIAKEERRSREG